MVPGRRREHVVIATLRRLAAGPRAGRIHSAMALLGHSRRLWPSDWGWSNRGAAVVDRVVPCMDGCRRGAEATGANSAAGAVSSRLQVCPYGRVAAFCAMAPVKNGHYGTPKKQAARARVCVP
jgi:hypothetical protein